MIITRLVCEYHIAAMCVESVTSSVYGLLMRLRVYLFMKINSIVILYDMVNASERRMISQMISQRISQRSKKVALKPSHSPGMSPS